MGVAVQRVKAPVMVMRAGALIAALALCGCSAPDHSPDSASAAATAAADASAAASAPPAPVHNWQYREGDEYGYQPALSQDDKNAGTVSEPVAMFKYLGQRNGLYRIESGGVISSCADPCDVIKIGGGEGAERITYNAGSVIGAAFEDAFNGQMDVYKPPKAKNCRYVEGGDGYVHTKCDYVTQ